MKYKIKTKTLKEALSYLVFVVNEKSHLPVLKNVFLRAYDDGVYITATNLEQSMSIRIDGGLVEQEGELLLPANFLLKYLGLSMDELCCISTDDSGNAKITLGKEKVTLTTMSTEDFPHAISFDCDSEVQTTFSISASDLSKAISKTSFACSTDMTRPALNGASFMLQNGLLRVAATDTYRLAEQKVSIDYSGGEKQVIVPKKSCDNINRLSSQGKDVTLTLSEYKLYASIDDGRIQYTTRLIEGKFPPYLQIIPKAFDLEITCDKQETQQCLKKISLFTDIDNNSFVQVSYDNNTMIFSSVKATTGETSDFVICEKTNGEGKILSRFNCRYFLETCGALDARKLVLKMQEKMAPMMVLGEGDDDFLSLLMPIRI